MLTWSCATGLGGCRGIIDIWATGMTSLVVLVLGGAMRFLGGGGRGSLGEIFGSSSPLK